MSTTEIAIEAMNDHDRGGDERQDRRIAQVAREVFGWDPLRSGIARAVAEVLRGRDVLGVMPTGYGKSGVYRIAGAMLPGTTVIVSPLIALQADQLAHLQETPGARPARLLNSTQARSATEETWELLAAGALGYLFLGPEQLANREVADRLVAADISLLTVDEAHCVSTWGHDFRPDYLRLGDVAERIGRPPILALKATGSRPVREEVVERLHLRDARILTHGFDRPNIHLSVVRHPDEGRKVAAVVDSVTSSAKPGLLYVATKRATEEYAEALADRAVAHAYHGGLPARRRRELSAAFHDGEVEVMAATSAFGMGIDKADVRFVVHASPPESIDEYYQEIGRAGRDGRSAQAVLHYRPEDLALRRFFASSVPKRAHLRALLAAVHEDPDLRHAAERSELSLRRATALAHLFEQAGVLRIANGRALPVRRTIDEAAAVDEAIAQAESHRRIEESRLAMMRSYAETTRCRHQYLLAYFGDEESEPCGNCDTRDSGDAERYAAERASTHEQPFPVDAPVTHAEWGDGRVVSVEDDRITVFFGSAGYRVLALTRVTEHDLLTLAAPPQGALPARGVRVSS